MSARHLIGLMAVSRALCSATGGAQPFGESVSLNLNPSNYSGKAPADSIIKSVSEPSIAVFPPGKKLESCSHGPDHGK